MTSWGGWARRQVSRLAGIEGLLKRAYPFALAFLEWKISVVRLHGLARSGGQGTLIVAGHKEGTSYLTSLFFTQITGREPLGVVPVWRLEGQLEKLRSSADMTVLRLNRLSTVLFLRRSYLKVPAWVNTVLHLPRLMDPRQDKRRLKEDLRLIRRGDFRVELTEADSQLTYFYESMYVPFMRQRHAGSAFVREEYWLRQRARRGGILWVSQAGERVAGILFERRGSVLHLWAEGIRDANPDLLKKGSIGALYRNVIDYARQQGCGEIDFGATRPSLGDGLLRYKRKWGMTFEVKRDNHHWFLIRCNDWSKVVAGFFSETPLLICSQAGLLALTSVAAPTLGTDAEVSRLHHACWTPGIRQLCVVSASGWEAGIQAPDRTSLVHYRSDGGKGFDELLDGLRVSPEDGSRAQRPLASDY